MPDYTVKADVDSMLRADNDAGIRSAIGLGQTDAPTFLAQTLTGQSLTGTQATSLVDLAATWNTSGTPTAIKLNVVETGINSPAASKLMDLQVGGVNRFSVAKDGSIVASGNLTAANGFISGYNVNGTNALRIGNGSNFQTTILGVTTTGYLGFAETNATTGPDLSLFRDAAGILAQRNGTAKQTLRIYNTYTSATVYERAVMDWNGPTPGNLQIGTEFMGSGSGMAARPIDFVTGGVVRMSMSTAGVNGPAELFGIGTVNFQGCIRSTGGILALGGAGSTVFLIEGAGQSKLIAGRDWLIGFASSTNGTPTNLRTALDTAISRNAAGAIEINTGTAGAYGFLKAKLQTSTEYTATVVVPTGFLTLYDSTGQAYRVPCVV